MARFTKIVDKHYGTIEAMIAELEEKRDEAQDYFDSRSEKWQESEAASDMEAQIEGLSNAIDSLNEALTGMDQAKDD